MVDHKRFAFIFAVDERGGFGLNGGLPWPKNKDDMTRFRALTMGNILCVGRETARVLPKLPGRHVIGLTRARRAGDGDGDGFQAGERPMYTMDELRAYAEAEGKRVMFGGGAKVLEGLNVCADIQWAHVSIIHGQYEADTWLDLNDWLYAGGWEQVTKTQGDGVSFFEYARGTALVEATR